jgi:hypothetical protein
MFTMKHVPQACVDGGYPPYDETRYVTAAVGAVLLYLTFRNITSAASTDSSNRSALPVLDMQNRTGILQLCSSCTFSLVNMSIVNDTATGAGGGMAVFRGQQDSKVNVLGGVSWRPACLPPGVQLQMFYITPRSVRFPSPPGAQLAVLVNVTYKVKRLQPRHEYEII